MCRMSSHSVLRRRASEGAARGIRVRVVRPAARAAGARHAHWQKRGTRESIMAAVRGDSVIADEAERAHASSSAMLAPEHWTEVEAPTFDGSDLHPARVWRRDTAVMIDGGPAPFKTQGVVVGVAPQVLAVMMTDIAMKDHELHKAPHERSTERELVQQLDPQTKVSPSRRCILAVWL